MIDVGHLEAVRLYVQHNIDSNGEVPANKTDVAVPESPWHVAILRDSLELSQFVLDTSRKIAYTYESDAQFRTNVGGDASDPTFPVQLGNGILKVAGILERAKPKLTAFEETLDSHEARASFESDSPYVQASGTQLEQSRELIDRMGLYLHTYLWILWTRESIEQADRFGELLADSTYFEDRTIDFPAYTTRPPMAVATRSCTALIEEVGTTYVNESTRENLAPADSSCSTVLDALERTHPGIDDFDIDSIWNNVVGSSDDVSRYVADRHRSVTGEGFEESQTAIMEGISLVRQLVYQLLADSLKGS